jgi:hypothetical protein
MPFSIRPFHRFPVRCSVIYNAGLLLRLPLLYFWGFWLLGTLLVLSSGLVYAEWVFVSKDDEAGTTVYIDPDTIRRKENLVKMWLLYDRKAVEGYGSIKSQNEYDCAEDRHRLLGSSIYSGHMGQGRVVYNNFTEGKWAPVVPDSRGQALWKYACGKK